MNSEQFNTMQTQLRKRMRHAASIQEFERMLDVEEALKPWYEGGGNGAIPFADELRAWGIEVPHDSPVPASGPTADDVTQILQSLGMLIDDNHPDWNAMHGAYREIRLWQRDGMNGPLPQADDLAKWAVWPPNEASTRPVVVQERPQTRPVVVQEPAQTPSRQKRQPPRRQDVRATQPVVQNVTSSPMRQPSAAPQAELDPDDRLQKRYENGLKAMHDGNYYLARQIFEELRPQVRGRLVEAVDNSYTEASNRLQSTTNRLITIARAEPDAQKQVGLWQEVLSANPDSTQATEALARIAQSQAEQEIGGQLPDLLRRAQAAAANDQLPELNALRGQVQAWKALGEKSPPEISPSLLLRVTELEEQVDQLRNETRSRLGESSTLLAGGDYREAYRRGRDLFERAVPKIVDVAGLFGPADEEVDTAPFFKQAQERFIGSLRSLALQRLDEAEAEQKQAPEKALETLNDARARLTDDVLTPDDKAGLKGELDLVDNAINNVEREIKRYNKAKAKVLQARSPGKRPAEALQLLQEAKEEYPDYPSLDFYIERALDGVGQVVATQVQNAMSNARSQMKSDQYEKALQTLANARTNAVHQIATPQADSGLAQTLTELAQLELEVTDAQANYEQMMELLAEVDGAISRFDGGDPRAIRKARHILDQFSDSERRHKEVRRRLADLMGRQDDVHNWRSGQAEYRQQNWKSAEETLRQVARGGTANSQEATHLADRALACQFAEEANHAESLSQWKEARAKYKQAVNLLDQVGTDALTAPILQQCQEAIQRLAPLEQTDREVEQKRRDAEMLYQQAQQQAKRRSYLRQKVEPIPQFASAAKLLEEVQYKQSTQTAEVHTLLQQIRQDWRKSYLDAMRQALTSLDVLIPQKAAALAQELEQASLLFEREDQQLARDLRLKALDNEYEQLLRATPIPWPQVEDNRKQRLALQQPNTPKHEQVAKQYREAVRQRILNKVHDLKRENPTGAKNYLTEELKRPELRSDEELITILIELCWELDDWREAERLASDIAFRRSRQSGEVWRALTRAAHSFKDGMVQLGVAEIEMVRQRYQNNTNLLALIAEKEDQFQKQAKETLLQQATKAMARRTDDGYIEAAEKYALAKKLDRKDSRISTGLKMLGSRLEPGIRKHRDRAKEMTLKRRHLEQAVKEIGRLHDALSAIAKVVDDLELDQELKEELKDTLEDIKPKYNTWKNVQEALDNAQRARNKALQTPNSLTTDSYLASGWDFSEARSHLAEGQRAAAKENERECLELIQTEQEALGTLEETAQTVTEGIQAFMEQLRQEEFDNVLREADQLATLWRDARQQAPWGGLEKLIQHPYPWYGRDVDRLEEHRRLTPERKANFEQWQGWSQAAEKSYQEAQNASKDVKNGLERVKEYHSLTEIITMCDTCIQVCNHFEREVNSIPETNPLSKKAEVARDKISKEAWTTEIKRYFGRAVTVKKQAEQGIARLRKQLAPLRKVINSQVQPFLNGKTSKFDPSVANKLLRKCEQIDRHHEDVVKYRKLIEQAEQRQPTRPPSKDEGWSWPWRS